MPSTPPDGQPAPTDGSLPEAALAGLAARRLSVYVHVPFCATRCGYCDFNTYTAAELGAAPGSSQDAYLAAAAASSTWPRRVLADAAAGADASSSAAARPTLLPAGRHWPAC